MFAKLTILMMLVFSALPTYAQTAMTPYTPRVRVEVYADNLAGKIQACLTQELRRLPGVTVVETEPEWIIDVIGFKPQNGAGTVLGYALSVVVLESLDLEQFDPEPSDPNPFDHQRLIRFIGTRDAARPVTHTEEPSSVTLNELKDHRLAVGSLGNLKRLCKEVVADFDTRHLEPMRQLLQSADDTVKE
jgi:hypothetical protein